MLYFSVVYPFRLTLVTGVMIGEERISELIILCK